MTAEKQDRGGERNVPASRQSWRKVSALATKQRGYVSTAQLRDAGISRYATLRAVRTGRLFRRRGGIFLVGHEHAPLHANLIAALVSVGPKAVLSHRSAAAIWGLMKWSGDADVTSSLRSIRRRGIVVHQGTLNQRYDVTHRHGFAVTSLMRTIVDLAGVLDEPRLTVAVNEAAIKGWLTQPFVRRLDKAITGRRGAVALRRVLKARDISKGRTRSSLEKMFAGLAREGRLPPYERGVLIDIGDGDIRECDVVWRDQKVMVELDSLPIHETGFVPYRDRRRDRRLTAAGWGIIRLTADDMTEHHAEVIADLHTTLSAAVPNLS